MIKKENIKSSNFSFKRKNAELTTQQIVIMIILIASFTIILMFLFMLDLGKTTDEQICHNSVIMASKNKLNNDLDCRIEYTCIASKEGDCENFNYNEKIEVNLNQKQNEIQKEVSKIIANEMSGCWWMFGEGKIDFVNNIIGDHCGICNEIKFGNELQKEIKISYLDFFKYLSRERKDETQTILNYLYDDSNISKIINQEEYLKENYNKNFELNKKYLIIIGRNKNIITDDKIIRPIFIKSEDISSTSCDVFDLTKP